MSITVVLNGYKRSRHFGDQLRAVKQQTVAPKSIMLWQNLGEAFDPALTRQTMHANCSVNLGVWARFAYALNANTDYVCVLDDDTMPGARWFENCLATMKTHEGLLGTIGVRYESPAGYYPSMRVGWAAPNESVERVDIVGHSWFFRRDWLSAFWRELPEINQSRLVGEDMHFSYCLQKYLGLGTFVPPHPPERLELWGSIPESAVGIGMDRAAISVNPANMKVMNDAYLRYIARGFRILAQGP